MGLFDTDEFTFSWNKKIPKKMSKQIKSNSLFLALISIIGLAHKPILGILVQ